MTIVGSPITRKRPCFTKGRETALRLLKALARFRVTEEGDVSKLTDIEPPEFRLRIGDYRVRFYDLGDSIEALRVRNREEAYR